MRHDAAGSKSIARHLGLTLHSALALRDMIKGQISNGELGIHDSPSAPGQEIAKCMGEDNASCHFSHTGPQNGPSQKWWLRPLPSVRVNGGLAACATSYA